MTDYRGLEVVGYEVKPEAEDDIVVLLRLSPLHKIELPLSAIKREINELEERLGANDPQVQAGREIIRVSWQMYRAQVRGK